MMTVVIGGSKCGKSSYAEKILDSFNGRKIYVATMIPYGAEADIAIKRHRKMRADKGFETIEKYTDIDEVNIFENSAVLLECMGNLCANEMFSDDEITDPTEKIISGIEQLKLQAQHFVIVTNNVFCDCVDYEKETMEYIKVMAEINRRMSENADNVIECVYGIPTVLKGTLL